MIAFHQPGFPWNKGISLSNRYILDILGAQVVWGRYNLTKIMSNMSALELIFSEFGTPFSCWHAQNAKAGWGKLLFKDRAKELILQVKKDRFDLLFVSRDLFAQSTKM